MVPLLPTEPINPGSAFALTQKKRLLAVLPRVQCLCTDP